MDSESAYLPPLDKLLSGDAKLVSWKSAHECLASRAFIRDNVALETFFYDAQTFLYLKKCPHSVPAPSAQSKSSFESVTAPIQVNESTNGEYSLQQMKKDALDLSQDLQIEELVALRVVILEWQQRARDTLVIGNEASSSALNSSALGKSSFDLSVSVNGAAKTGVDISDDAIRRRRQLEIYLEEVNSLLKISTELLSRYAASDISETNNDRSWLDDIARQLSENRLGSRDQVKIDTVFTDCMESLDNHMQKLDDTTKMPAPFRDDPSMQMAFASATFTDITTIFKLVLAVLHRRDDIPAPAMVSAWFRRLEDVNYFQTLLPSPAWPDTTEIQCLVSAVSLAILDVSSAIANINDTFSPSLESVSYPQLENGPYVQSEDSMRELSTILYRAANNEIAILAPSIFAFSLITTLLRTGAGIHNDLRDQRIENVSSDNEITGRRRSSRRDSREEMTKIERVYASTQDPELDYEANEDPPAWFARVAVDAMGLFSVVSSLSNSLSATAGVEAATSSIARAGLLDLVREGIGLIYYEAPILEAVISLLSPDVPTSYSTPVTDRTDSQLASSFLSDPIWRQGILDQALARYPFELSPLLRLLTSTAPGGPQEVVQLLQNLQSSTVMVPEHFTAYQLMNEDENTNEMVLTDRVPLFFPKKDYLQLPEGESTMEDADSDTHFTIPAGTHGTIVKENRPKVLKLDYSHSGLGYLGLLLATVLPNAPASVGLHSLTIDRRTAAEMVTLINALLTACSRGQDAINESRAILAAVSYSSSADSEASIITVIRDLFEVELLAHVDQSAQDGSLDLLVACAEFFLLLVAIEPERSWAALAHSSLLGLSGGSNALAAVVGATESAFGRYRFLAATARLYEAIIDDTIGGMVKRRGKHEERTLVTRSHRFDSHSPESRAEYTSERTITNVVSAYTQVMLEAWENLAEWRFVVPADKSIIAQSMLAGFVKFLRCTYGLEDSTSKDKGISSLLKRPTEAILSSLTSSESNGSALQAFASVFATGAASFKDIATPTTPSDRKALMEQNLSAVELLTTALRSLRLQKENRKRGCDIAVFLVRSMPDLAILFACQPTLVASLATLLTEITVNLHANSEGANPPSLLSYLGARAAKAFLTALSQLGRPFCDHETEVATWSFLSTVLRSGQQWMALFLLTGNSPRERLEENSTNMSHSKSLLQYTLSQLSRIERVTPLDRSAALLGFIAAAQGSWVWASNEVRSHSDFLRSMLEWVHGLKTPGRPDTHIQAANETLMATRVCEILAGTHHAAMEVGDMSVLSMLSGKLDWLIEHGADVNAYNRSLHRNLAENFERRFGGVSVADFKRSAANPPLTFGDDFFYDVELANAALGYEKAWLGSVNGKGQGDGFKNEMQRANINLSLVSAQTALLGAWSALATTMAESVKSADATARPQLIAGLARAAENCLLANANAKLEVPGTDKIVSARAEMAFVILSAITSLPADKAATDALKAVLPAIWQLVITCPVDFDVATEEHDLNYYRALLQILFLAIQPHIKEPNGQENGATKRPVSYLDPAVARILGDVVGRTIAPAFRALCGNLHTSVALAQPSDFAMITALLQSVLAVPGVHAIHAQLAEIVASSSLVRSALSLYSWSDRLAEVMNDDPIFGEITITFLLVLSTIKPVAEAIALDGALARLSSASLSQYFRKDGAKDVGGGKGPFDEPRRMFNIWTEGFLPLCLNLLDAVGPPIAAEVSGFLNGFPMQLARANVALENKETSRFSPHSGAVTLGLVTEAHSLCLISIILNSDVARAAAEGIDASAFSQGEGGNGVLRGYDHKKVIADGQHLVRQKASLASRIQPASPLEEEWLRRSVDGVDTVLSAKIIAEVVAIGNMGGDEQVN